MEDEALPMAQEVACRFVDAFNITVFCILARVL
jgi:hypothetical protein